MRKCRAASNGRPFGLPETPGGHIRPFTCLVGSSGILFISLAARGTGLPIRRQVLERKKGPIEHSSRFS